jgi:hypothetical protein
MKTNVISLKKACSCSNRKRVQSSWDVRRVIAWVKYYGHRTYMHENSLAQNHINSLAQTHRQVLMVFNTLESKVCHLRWHSMTATPYGVHNTYTHTYIHTYIHTTVPKIQMPGAQHIHATSKTIQVK